jgi:hypothetical protein
MNVKGKSKQVLVSTKQGLRDIWTVVEEGGFKLFLMQAIAIMILVLLFRWVSGKLDDRNENIKGRAEALQAQQSNEKEYMSSKSKLLNLEPRFPDIDARNNWLLKEVDTVFREYEIKPAPKVGSQTEDTNNSAYTVVSVPIELTATYAEVGNLLAKVEGREEFLKVSEFLLTKNPISKDSLGTNSVKLRIDAVFPAEKVAKVLFKDAPKQGGTK